jgi:hypothetical protein
MARWVATSIRVRHLDAAAPGAGAGRRAKYEQAYPNGDYRRNLPGLTDEADALVPWTARPADLAVLEAPVTEPVGTGP